VNSVGAVCKNVNELVGISDIPLLREEGWTRHQDKWREATLFWSGRGGRSQAMLRECIPKLAL
jgi:hypothetical protein